MRAEFVLNEKMNYTPFVSSYDVAGNDVIG